MLGAAFLLLVATAPAAAGQTAPTAAATAPDPARLAAAQAVIARLMPADRRDAMVDQMIRPMIENMRSSMLESPMFKEIAADPKVSGTFDKFINGQLDRTVALTKELMPAMLDAMARAYARRFTLDQLAAIGAFYDTPAGRAYAELAPTIMADPDVLAAQRAMMTRAMADAQQRIAAMVAELADEKQEKK
ncbi:DUF2059 domain-containing protein [Sphingomonas sp. MMS12-HWE2-04]|uniref:DUF2059 domain-containing protein n=1 Tax=Sphingomonas sp. MMS12-HWE2-04 TaxID=3234199 RepID=UPI00384E5895